MLEGRLFLRQVAFLLFLLSLEEDPWLFGPSLFCPWQILPRACRGRSLLDRVFFLAWSVPFCSFRPEFLLASMFSLPQNAVPFIELLDLLTKLSDPPLFLSFFREMDISLIEAFRYFVRPPPLWTYVPSFSFYLSYPPLWISFLLTFLSPW